MTALGFIGTGHLASFFIEGLVRAGAGYAITVSSRNAATAESLRCRYGVGVAGNQQVVDGCDLIVVSVLPHQAHDVLGDLRFRPGQTVLSVMSGVRLHRLRDLVAPAQAAVSMMPGAANAYNAGPSVLFPGIGEARRLLQWLGPVHVHDDEQSFIAASVMGAFSGMATLVMKDAIDWFESRGLGHDEARRLVAETVSGNARVLLEDPRSLRELTDGVVTPGGITELGRRSLEAGKSWPEALDAVLNRMTASE